MSVRIKYHFKFTWPMEFNGLHLGDLDIDGAAVIYRYREDRAWEVEDYLVRGTCGKVTDIANVFGGYGISSSLCEAAKRELERPEHRAAIEDMLRQMSGQDAAA